MTTNDLIETIDYWTKWASEAKNQRYDIALMKIWVQFERFISELFVLYATGSHSEKGYSPDMSIVFNDESQLNAFLRSENKKYIDYLPKIENLSKHIFKENPFDAIFLDADNYKVYQDVFCIRNYVAHESGDAKRKLIKQVFSGNDKNFQEPMNYLLTKEKKTKRTYYTYYSEKLKEISSLLIDKVS